MLVACWTLDDQERRAALLRRHERLDAAFLANAAFHDGKQLEQVRRDLDADLDYTPEAAPVLDDVIAAANEHVAQLHANR